MEISVMYGKVKFLNDFIEYLKNTDINDWCEKVYRTVDNKNCLFGHLVEYFEKSNYEDENIAPIIDTFENQFASTYMVFPVNDGTSELYKQDNPRDRCIAYFTDMMNGKVSTTWET